MQNKIKPKLYRFQESLRWRLIFWVIRNFALISGWCIFTNPWISILASQIQEHFVIELLAANNLPQPVSNNVDILQKMTGSQSTGATVADPSTPLYPPFAILYTLVIYRPQLPAIHCGIANGRWRESKRPEGKHRFSLYRWLWELSILQRNKTSSARRFGRAWAGAHKILSWQAASAIYL